MDQRRSDQAEEDRGRDSTKHVQIRYTVAELKALAASPLVERPADLPAIDTYHTQLAATAGATTHLNSTTSANTSTQHTRRHQNRLSNAQSPVAPADHNNNNYNADDFPQTSKRRENKLLQQQQRDEFPRPPKVTVDSLSMSMSQSQFWRSNSSAKENKEYKEYKEKEKERDRRAPRDPKDPIRAPRRVDTYGGSNNNYSVYSQRQSSPSYNKDRRGSDSQPPPAWMVDDVVEIPHSKKQTHQQSQRQQTQPQRTQQQQENDELTTADTESTTTSTSSSDNKTNHSLIKNNTAIVADDAPEQFVASGSTTSTIVKPTRTNTKIRTQLDLASTVSAGANFDPRYKGLDPLQIFRLKMKEKERRERGKPEEEGVVERVESTALSTTTFDTAFSAIGVKATNTVVPPTVTNKKSIVDEIFSVHAAVSAKSANLPLTAGSIERKTLAGAAATATTTSRFMELFSGSIDFSVSELK
ncbi:hypothetical protein HK100_011860 [Physocladia obscura]|uniref:Uncharacterized protein n=1 Tax=Physocladia obscura TaxID=109957 RepID=A0AAD5T188_9FUNG|nr:hypothetical protein HK100_011860 [Physocladia obscura]